MPALATFDFTPPSNWAELERSAFEKALSQSLDGTRVARLGDATLRTLADALPAGDETALRAALILARTRDPRAGEALLARLESRNPHGAADPVDTLAAAAFAHWASARDAPERLQALADGKKPYPDLDVRVECAAVALELGRDGVIPFLLDVLLEGTPAARKKPDWKRPDWMSTALDAAQARAAQALSARARVPCAYRPEASIAEREAEVARLSQILLPRATPKK